MLRPLRNLVTIKVLIGAFIFGVVVFAVLLWVLWSSKTNAIGQIPATAILKIIEAPTQAFPMNVLTSTPTLVPIGSQQTPAPSGDITIGNYVQVSGTGGDGLRLHNTASVSSKVNYIANDSKVFVVKDGPINADGYVWWELVDPDTGNAVGWGVADYLKVVQNP